MALSATGGGGGSTKTSGWKAIEADSKKKPKLLPKKGYKQSHKGFKSPVPALTKALVNPGSGVGAKVINPSKPAPPKPAAKPALKPTPKPGAAPYKAPTAPVVVSGTRSPQPPTVAGKPVSKSNPIPAKAAPAKAPAAKPGNYWDPFNDQAKKSIEAQNLPALNEIQRQMDEIAARGKRAAGDLTETGQREQANLAEIYKRLSNFQAAIQGEQDKNYDNLRGEAGSRYDQLTQNLNQTFDAGQARSSAEAQRLGIAHTADPNAGSERDQAFLTGLAGVDKANLQGGFDLAEGGFDKLISMSRMNAGQEGAMRQATAMRENSKSLQDLQFELQQALIGLGGKRLDIKSVEGQRIAELAQALEDKQYNRTAEQKQQQFQNDLAMKNFNLSAEQARAALMPQAPAPPSEYESLQVAKLKQDLMNEQALLEAQIAAMSAKSAPQIRRTGGGLTAWS